MDTNAFHSGIMIGSSSGDTSSSGTGSSGFGTVSGAGFGVALSPGFDAALRAGLVLTFDRDSELVLRFPSDSAFWERFAHARRAHRLKSPLSICSRTCSEWRIGLMLSGSSLPPSARARICATSCLRPVSGSMGQSLPSALIHRRRAVSFRPHSSASVLGANRPPWLSGTPAGQRGCSSGFQSALINPDR